MDENKLIERLLRIEALRAGATTRGERVAAAMAMQRILEHLREIQEFQELQEALYDYLGEVTDRVISQAIHKDSSEAAERQEIAPPAS